MSTDMAVKDISQFELRDKRTTKGPLKVAVKDPRLGNPIITVGKQWSQFYGVPFEHVGLIPAEGDYVPGFGKSPDPNADLFMPRVKNVVMGKKDEANKIQYVGVVVGKVIPFGEED